MLLGDGIEHVQTTKAGDVWTGYFDEGVYGNLGKSGPEAIGQAGLVRFDRGGKVTYSYDAPSGLGPIDDCYALNVVSNGEVYLYYYSDFRVVQLRNGRVSRHWTCPVRGAIHLAVFGDFILMTDGYQSIEWKLIRLGKNGDAAIERTVDFNATDGTRLPPRAAVTRGDHVWFLINREILHADLRSLMRGN